MKLGGYDLHPCPRELFLKSFQSGSSTGFCWKSLVTSSVKLHKAGSLKVAARRIEEMEQPIQTFFSSSFLTGQSRGGEVVKDLCYEALDAWWYVEKHQLHHQSLTERN